ncbi:MAG: SWIM zinc finger family protein [Pseudonocardia sediminis]
MSAARGFPAFPAQRGTAARGRSWWARAWVAAVEDTSLDHSALRRSRKVAGSGRVGPITVSPGRLAAAVDDPDAPDGLHASVALAVLSDEEWSRLLEQVAAESGHLAALLSGEVPRALVQAADAAGVALLPDIGDLDPECDCPDWGNPCVHAGALCYQAAWLLDTDPFVLLLLRGRDRDEIVAALTAGPERSAPDAGPPDGDRLAALVERAAGRARALLAGSRLP